MRRYLTFAIIIACCDCTGTLGRGLTNSTQNDGSGGASGGTSGPSAGSVANPNIMFEAIPPSVYVSKVKTLLTGVSADANEVGQVTLNSNNLRPMIEAWLNTSQAQNVITAFFTTAFQQKNLSPTSFGDQLAGESCGGWWILMHENNFIGRGSDRYQVNARYVQEFTESFGRTAWQLTMVENQPFTSTLTTRRFMMTPTMVSTMLFFDRYRAGFKNVGQSGSTPEIGGCGHVGYADVYSHYYTQEVYNSYQVNAGVPIPIADTLNPSSPNFMHWVTADPYANFTGINFPVLQAGPDAIYLMLNGLAYSENPQFFVQIVKPQWADTDFSDWKMVTVKQAEFNDIPPRFWDLPRMRTMTTVPLLTPRVGFFSTPAFFANWLTNQSNQFRVTANQMLIVALGQSLLDASVVVRSANNGVDENASDAEHLANPACSSCHVTLDPLRHFYTQSYDPTYEPTKDPNAYSLESQYLVDGANKSGKTLDDLAQILAADPAFAPTWVGKVCQWVNSTPCDATDPEFIRIANAFKANNFNFRTMLTDVLSSPLVTGAQATQTWEKLGEPMSIARYDRFCLNLQQRLNLPGACTVTAVAAQNASNVPTDNYVRGSSQPYLPSQPSLFFRTAVENLCTQLAPKVVDGPNAVYLSNAAPAALSGLVTTVMGIDVGDPRYQEILTLLTSHYTTAVAGGATASNALQSAFTVACTAPSSVGTGL